MYNEIKLILAGVITSTSLMFDSCDIALKVLLVMIVLDVFTGMIKGFVTKKLSSSIGRQGIGRKVMILVIVAVSYLLDLIFNINIIQNISCVFYIAVEGISIMENAGQIGLPLPKGIKERLEQLKDMSIEKRVE